VERPLSIPTELPPLRSRPGASELAAIFAGGSLGALLRSALEHTFPVHGGAWPWPTFAVNLVAAGLLGYLFAHSRASSSPPSLRLRAFIGAGMCGALSTFSTLMVELLGMLESSRWGLAAGYASASIAGGLAIVALTGALARRRAGQQ
jgi:fluoride exporter